MNEDLRDEFNQYKVIEKMNKLERIIKIADVRSRLFVAGELIQNGVLDLEGKLELCKKKEDKYQTTYNSDLLTATSLISHVCDKINDHVKEELNVEGIIKQTKEKK